MINLIKNHKMSFLSFLLVMVAAALGANSAFAMAEVAVISTTIPDKTAVPAGKEGDPDAAGLKTVREGAASASQVTETGFEQEEIDRAIAQYLLFKFPLQHYIINEARQVPVESMHPKHFRAGTAQLDIKLSAQVAVGSGSYEVSSDEVYMTIPATSIPNSFKCLKPYTEVYFIGVPGYDPNTYVQKGYLAGYIVEASASSIKMIMLNAKTKASMQNSDLTAIPVNTVLYIGATAGSETQMIVAPENYQPVPKEVYLQKKLANFVWTKEWERIAKESVFVEKDLKNNVLYQFKYKNAVTHWLGTQTVKKIDVGGDLGEELVYFEEGLLNQVNMFYSYDKDGLVPEDFNAIAKLQFTRFAKNGNAVGFCGANFIERMLNMDVTRIKNVDTKVTEVAQGLKVHRWENNFGTIDFVYDPIFSEIGFSDFCFICDMAETTRYVKREEKEDTLDLTKTSEAREATRKMYSIIDCIALRGYNAVLVGPSDKIALAQGLGSMEDTIVSKTASAMASYTPTDGVVVYISGTAAYTDSKGNVWPAGSLIQYKAATTTWVDYQGAL